MVTVKVRNFQSIKNSEIEVRGFTAVTGANNSGKTAFCRATRGVFQNTPGTGFIRHGETECEVSVAFDDGEITWNTPAGKRSMQAARIVALLTEQFA